MIDCLINKNPDSVQGETDAGPMEQAKKINEIIDVVNKLQEVIEDDKNKN